MFYEDITVDTGETVADIAEAYGYKRADVNKIWDDKINAALKQRRTTEDKVQKGDMVMVPIPWTIVSKTMKTYVGGAGLTAKRDGENGKNLRWCQTVYQHNQPVKGYPADAVDACPPDDDMPFYFTNAELSKNPDWRKEFVDFPRRPPPSKVLGTTKWRAVLSIALVHGKRVTIWDAIKWGFDLDPDGTVAKVEPKAVTDKELETHLHILHTGFGTGPDPFEKAGWKFRKPLAAPVQQVVGGDTK